MASSESRINKIIFYALLALIVLTAIPYGAPQPWWKATFQSFAFLLAAVSVGWQCFAKNSFHQYQFARRLVLPLLAIFVFAFIQTITLPPFLRYGADQRTTLSADVFATRQWLMQMSALLCVGSLVLTHANQKKLQQRLIDVLIGVGTASALFGIARQALQRSEGFVIPHLRAGYGYAQFINSNHFAFLMEMTFGLAIGMIVCRGIKGGRVGVYLAAAVPMWFALVLSGSRGGILSMLCQVLLLVLIAGLGRKTDSRPAVLLSDKIMRATRSVAVRAVLIVVLLTGAITTVISVGGDPLGGRMDALGVELDRNVADVYTLRPNIWRATWRLIKTHPFAGSGFGGYWVAITKHHTGSGETTPQEAHNDYLELLASGGILGLGLVLWFCWQMATIIRTKLRMMRSGDAEEETSFARAAMLAALVATLTVAVHSLVDFGLHIPINAIVYTVLIALICLPAMHPRLD